MGNILLNIKMVRLLGITSLLFLSHVSLVAAGTLPLVPRGKLVSRACASGSYGI